MTKLKRFIITSVLGGVVVILPLAILLFVFRWVFDFVTGLIRPFTAVAVSQANLREPVAILAVLAVIILACFMLGVFVRTALGKMIYGSFERKFLVPIPGYSLIKETVTHLSGRSKTGFRQVALVQPFGNETLATGFVTDTASDGTLTVFVPTGPNPTSGFVYHLAPERVHIINVSAEDAMRTIISCGAGSAQMLAALRTNDTRAIETEPTTVEEHTAPGP